jgi:hypothetical protein
MLQRTSHHLERKAVIQVSSEDGIGCPCCMQWGMMGGGRLTVS